MPTVISPSGIVLFARDEIRDAYLRDYALRNPAAVTGQGSQPWIDASAIADTLTPVYANAAILGYGIALQTMTMAQLTNEAARLGTAPIPPTGASGYVIAQGSVGGGTIFAGDEIKGPSGLRYQCTATAVYLPGSYVPIAGVDTGPSTNVNAGTTMTWSTPRRGIGPSALVAAQPGNVGLFGGRNAETVAQLVQRLINIRANPPASGNDAQIQQTLSGLGGLPIQQPFTYPAANGPGSYGFTFTLTPSQPGGSRIPSSAQLATALALLVSSFPADYSFLATTIASYPVTPMFTVTWAPGATGWADASPWPAYVAGDTVNVLASPAPTATTFRLSTVITSTTTPAVGQTIAFYDQPNAVWRAKKILTVSVVVAGQTWDITVDTTFNSSDVSYTPLVGQPASPYSDSLQSLAVPVASYFDGIGPGEEVSPLPDPNLRQRRSPVSPAIYPSQLTNRIVLPLLSVTTVQDAVLVAPTVPYAPPTGSVSLVNMLTLNNFAVFPQ